VCQKVTPSSPDKASRWVVRMCWENNL